MKTYVGDTNNLSVNAKKVYCGYNNKALTLPIVETGDKRIFGAVWDGSADTFWTRTDDSIGWQEPNPYYAGMSGTPSSPCDDIMPWAGMVKSEHPQAGTVVAIPKFYVRIEYANPITNVGLSIKIAPGSNGDAWALSNGFICSPAHMNRGDGVGERDVVYVGRYHCADNYKSITGVLPKGNISRSQARTGIHALGSDIWQNDYAMRLTIAFLYLVEFADWNSQAKIGYGCGNNSAKQNVGATDSMPYHTGTMQTSRTTFGVGVQYRNIEGLWENCYDWGDGIYTNSNAVYIILNPNSFSMSGGVFISERPTAGGHVSSWSIPAIEGYEWAIFPASVNGSDSTYTCDSYNRNNTSVTGLRMGGTYVQTASWGMFTLVQYEGDTTRMEIIGSRLMVLPNAA